MASASEASDQGDRRLFVASLVALGAVTGAAFGRAFAGSAVSARLAIAGALAVGIAALMRRRPLALSLLVSAAVLVVVLGIIVFPQTTWGGLPTRGTLLSIWEALGRAGHRTATEVAPARPLPPLMVAAIVAVWAAGTASHALAVRSRAGILPLLPGAALMAFAGVVSEDGSRPGYVIAYLATALTVLFATGLDRVRLWGPTLSAGVTRGRLAAGSTGRWARVLGASAVLVAVVLPGVVPGFGSSPILDVEGRPGRVGISPIVDIRPSLLQNPPGHLFEVDAAQGAYWRLVALDRFDGRLWTATDLRAEQGEDIGSGGPLSGVPPVSGVRLEQTFVIRDLSTTWLPAAFQPMEADLGDASGRYDSESGILVAEDETLEGDTYSVTSRIAVPSPAELDRAYEDRPLGPAAARALPPTIPPSIYGLAHSLTRTAETPFRKALAIQQYLRTFTYDDKAPAGHGIDDMVYFLERSKRGYCEQFAGTMAVLLRALGIPARVAVGFLPGDRDRRTGRWVVTTAQIHAWPEVYFPTYGWLAFEPTPSRSNPQADYLLQLPDELRPDANLPGAGGSATAAAGGRGRSQRVAHDRPVPPPPPTARRPRAAPRTGASPLRVTLAFTTLALLLAISLVVAKVAVRRFALSRATSPRRRVVAAFRVLELGAADLRLGRRPGETVWEYRSRLRSSVAFSDGHLDRIAGLASHALYSTGPITEDQAEAAVEASRALLRDLRHHAGRVRTAVGAVRPSPGP